jgi:hypothetical protein
MKNRLILLSLIAISNIYSCQQTVVVHSHVYKDVPAAICLSNNLLSYILTLSVACSQDNKQPFECEKWGRGDFVFFKLYNSKHSCFLYFNNVTRNCMIQCTSRDDGFDYIAFKRVIDFFLINY